MPWGVEYTNEFGVWWDTLTETQQDDVTAAVQLLREGGPTLRFPHSSGIAGSKHPHLRELRVQIGFMRSIFPLLIGSMTRIGQNADARG